MSVKTNTERLIELAEGWECAARAEQAVMAGFQAWKEQFDADERSPEILRYTRVWCEARDNRDRFEKDAAAIRWALLQLDTSASPSAEGRVEMDAAQARAAGLWLAPSPEAMAEMERLDVSLFRRGVSTVERAVIVTRYGQPKFVALPLIPLRTGTEKP